MADPIRSDSTQTIKVDLSSKRVKTYDDGGVKYDSYNIWFNSPDSIHKAAYAMAKLCPDAIVAVRKIGGKYQLVADGNGIKSKADELIALLKKNNIDVIRSFNVKDALILITDVSVKGEGI
jgi:hypothetical protein